MMRFWKEYSINYIKNNKVSTIAIITAAFIASLFLSLLCGVFFNIWNDDIRLIKAKEGDWHAKITAELSAGDLEVIRNHPDVRTVVISKEEKALKTAVLYFYHARQVYEKLPGLVLQLGLEKTAVIEYHDKLLSRYFVYAKGHNPPPIILVYLGTLLITSVSLILVIHNAFGVSMMSRLRQLAILQSIGASPRQLCTALVNEAVILCLIPIFSGVIAGYGLCYLFMAFMKNIVRSVRTMELIFQYPFVVMLAAFTVSVLTVWFSAFIPAKKLSRLSPLEAIRCEDGEQIEHVRRFYLISRILGVEGELARKSLYIRRKTFRTATISITLSFLVFSSFLCIETISRLSTQYSFFERYKDTWNLMLTMHDIGNRQKELLSDIRKLADVENCIAYRKVSSGTVIDDTMLSKELKQLGGLEKLKNTGIPYEGMQYRIKAPLVILDDQSFARYCHEVGINSDRIINSGLPQVVVVNKIWDNKNSNRRNRRMIPFLQIKKDMSLKLMPYEKKEGDTFDETRVIVAAATDKLPLIREGFDDFSLIQVLPDSSYEKTGIISNNYECYYTILANSVNSIETIANSIRQLLGDKNNYTLENKLETEQDNVKFRNIYKIVIGSLCVLLTCIGLANVLSNALGLIYERKREFARYISIGLSPMGVLKLLMLEAAILAIKPILISLLINIPIIILSLNASFIKLDEFLKNVPVVPISGVAAVIIVIVMSAYYIGGRRLCRINLVDALKDDTLAA